MPLCLRVCTSSWACLHLYSEAPGARWPPKSLPVGALWAPWGRAPSGSLTQWLRSEVAAVCTASTPEVEVLQAGSTQEGRKGPAELLAQLPGSFSRGRFGTAHMLQVTHLELQCSSWLTRQWPGSSDSRFTLWEDRTSHYCTTLPLML